MFEFRHVDPTLDSLNAYAQLFGVCFPNADHLNISYLKWLYVDNPDGVVVGFDAFDNGRLAAHYACIPVKLNLFGQLCKGLLSLNTATHPSYQGKGLFTKLASKTYDFAFENGFEGVYGVANANSTPGFTKKLGFTLVSPLEARVGVGSLAEIDWLKVTDSAQFRRIWDAECMRWRLRNPVNPAVIVASNRGEIQVRAATNKPMISACASVAGSFEGLAAFGAGKLLPRASLFLGLLPDGAHRFRWSISIPQRMRPSPLNFIYRGLQDSGRVPTSTGIVCSFLDFDAY
jgi:GNAT superfamily N-acetyltransferase